MKSFRVEGQESFNPEVVYFFGDFLFKQGFLKINLHMHNYEI